MQTKEMWKLLTSIKAEKDDLNYAFFSNGVIEKSDSVSLIRIYDNGRKKEGAISHDELEKMRKDSSYIAPIILGLKKPPFDKIQFPKEKELNVLEINHLNSIKAILQAAFQLNKKCCCFLLDEEQVTFQIHNRPHVDCYMKGNGSLKYHGEKMKLYITPEVLLRILKTFPNYEKVKLYIETWSAPIWIMTDEWEYAFMARRL